MSRLIFSLLAIGWCAFWAGVMIHTMKYASTPILTIGGLVFIFIGWVMMLQIAKDC